MGSGATEKTRERSRGPLEDGVSQWREEERLQKSKRGEIEET